MSALGFRRDVSVALSIPASRTVRQEGAHPSLASAVPGTSSEPREANTSWSYVRLFSWLVASLAGIVTFVMPIEILQLTTFINVTVAPSSDLYIDETTAGVFMQTGAVVLLLLASSLPCRKILCRVCSAVSLLVAAIYWIVIVSNDRFHVIREGFAVFLMFALLFPLIVSSVYTLRALMYRKRQLYG